MILCYTPRPVPYSAFPREPSSYTRREQMLIHKYPHYLKSRNRGTHISNWYVPIKSLPSEIQGSRGGGIKSVRARRPEGHTGRTRLSKLALNLVIYGIPECVNKWVTVVSSIELLSLCGFALFNFYGIVFVFILLYFIVGSLFLSLSLSISLLFYFVSLR